LPTSPCPLANTDSPFLSLGVRRCCGQGCMRAPVTARPQPRLFWCASLLVFLFLRLLSPPPTNKVKRTRRQGGGHNMFLSSPSPQMLSPPVLFALGRCDAGMYTGQRRGGWIVQEGCMEAGDRRRRATFEKKGRAASVFLRASTWVCVCANNASTHKQILDSFTTQQA
jgi:hypothetical protein